MNSPHPSHPTGPALQPGGGSRKKMRMLKPGRERKRTLPGIIKMAIGALMLIAGLGVLVFGSASLISYLISDHNEQPFTNSTTVTLRVGEERAVWIYGPPVDDAEVVSYPSLDTCTISGPDGEPVKVDTSNRAKGTNQERSRSTLGTFRAEPPGGTYTVECDGEAGKLSDPPAVERLMIAIFCVIGGVVLAPWGWFLLKSGRRRRGSR